mgnify:CR=1 FL=1
MINIFLPPLNGLSDAKMHVCLSFFPQIRLKAHQKIAKRNDLYVEKCDF